MSEHDEVDSIDGLSVERATEVVAETEARDPEEVRVALEYVAEDGVVSQSGVEAALAQASKVVSTPETRVELAAMALSEVKETAASVADVPTVQARLDGFESRLETIESQVAQLGVDLQALLDQSEDPEAIYEVARGLRQLTATANELQGAADDLQLDLESFERWVGNATVRDDHLDADVSAFENRIDELASAIDGPAKADGIVWAEATIRHRVDELLLADLRAELADLRTLDERQGIDDETGDDIEAQLDGLEARLDALGERLDGIETEHAGELSAFESALAGFEPPIDWGEVRAVVKEYSAAIEGLA